VSSAAKFVVFLPVRNGERYIGKAVESVLAQTEADLRIYVLDNASGDGTLAIVRSFQDPRIAVQESSIPLSIEQSWARILPLVQAGVNPNSIVTLLGHDDILYPEFLAEIGRLAAAHPNASLFQTHFHLVDQNGRTIRPCAPMPAVETGSEYFRSRAWGCRDSYGTGYAFKASDYVAVGGIPDFPGLLFADDALFFRLASRSYKVTSPSVEFAYRVHDSGASLNGSVSRNSDYLRALDRWRTEILERHPALIQDEITEVAFGRMIVRTLEAVDLGLAEWRYDPEVRTLKRRLTTAAGAHLRGLPYSGRDWKVELMRSVLTNVASARTLLRDALGRR